MMKKILTYTGIALAVALVVIQFFPVEKNNSNENQYHISTKYNVPPEIGNLLKGACNDCHSNLTKYPWYASIQPVGWWLDGHIRHGKGELNFSEFTSRPAAVQYHKFEEIVEVIDEKEMPLSSYTLFGLHPEGNLSDKERERLIIWAQGQMAMMKVIFPQDSLERKRE